MTISFVWAALSLIMANIFFILFEYWSSNSLINLLRSSLSIVTALLTLVLLSSFFTSLALTCGSAFELEGDWLLFCFATGGLCFVFCGSWTTFCSFCGCEVSFELCSNVSLKKWSFTWACFFCGPIELI